ncbi:MAG: dephospho-CoA kinase [Chloroflexi bacterium]|nr:dephospho-CoA kinase [Chloroflexota bacterium]
MTARPFLIGLTGPIGCGKSTVAGMLAELGATVIDADAVAAAATGRGEATLSSIRARFGEGIFAPDGSLERAALARVVFEDPAALRDLEAIVHPEVRRRVEAALESATQAGALVVVVEAIKLVEGGLAARCDEVWLITCRESDQRFRLTKRGMPVEEAARRMASQGADLAERLGPHATRRVDTSGTAAETLQRVEDALADALAPLLLGEGHQ